MSGTVDSWEERVDWALGQAGVLLERAVQQFMAGTLDADGAEAASTLAEALRDLAAQWGERLEGAEEAMDPETEDTETETPSLSRTESGCT